MTINYDYFAHIARQIMNEPELDDPNLITGKETKDCWKERDRNHVVLEKND